jgi:hypothetical protein
VESERRDRKEQERVLQARERLRFRVYAAVRDLALGTELFRTHFELHEPEVSVGVFARFVDVCVALTEGQLRLLPTLGRSRDLGRFAQELHAGLARVADGLDLEPERGPDPLGLSGPVELVGVPIGVRAILRRRSGD